MLNEPDDLRDLAMQQFELSQLPIIGFKAWRMPTSFMTADAIRLYRWEDAGAY